MARRMPVLRQHDMVVAGDQAVDRGNDLVAARHRKRAARAEVVLHVDDD